MDSNPHKNKVHRVLAHSYSVYFILFLVGVALDFTFQFKIFTSNIWTPVGGILLIVGSFLVLWAQKANRNIKMENVSKENFCKGPYCYVRHPTHWGLFFLILGFGIILNALFVILCTLISFIITKFVFIEKQERILAEKYGAPYVEYKKSVKF